mgnify:CR=1 FL=1
MTLFQELILISIGKRNSFSRPVNETDWQELYIEACKQSLTGVLLNGVERFQEFQKASGVKYEMPYCLFQWMGEAMMLERKNQRVTERAKDLTKIFAKAGFRSTVLKGQSIALLYPQPDRRQCGDIDFWVDGSRKDILSFVNKSAMREGTIFIHHIDADYFDDVSTEIHTFPTYCYSPFRYRKYKKFFRLFKDECFVDNSIGFSSPSIRFNAVYLLLHIFRHIYNEGIGLRQLMDYYYCLLKLTSYERIWAFSQLKTMGLDCFAASIMYVEQIVFELEDEFLLCPPNEKYGQYVLDEIMRVGNFGHYDEKRTVAHSKGGIHRYVYNVCRLLKLIGLCPSEVIWAPIWKPCHFIWRKIKGYS